MLAARKVPQAAPAYEFTQDWFSSHEAHWRALFERVPPGRVLEIGCYEGRASTFFIEQIDRRSGCLACVDTWAGSVDLPPAAMRGVERRFDSNVEAAIERTDFHGDFRKLKKRSTTALAGFIAEGAEPFDVIYIDGSHTAPDVLADAVFAFQMLRVGGAMVFDDYRWQWGAAGIQDPLNMPKPAIDAFINLYLRKIRFSAFGAGQWQLLVVKTGD